MEVTATQPGTQIAPVQKVICAQNLDPKDKIDDVDVKGKKCAEIPAWPVRMGDDIAVHVTGYRNEKDLRLFVEGIELPNLQLQYQGTDKNTTDDVFRTTLRFDDSTSGRESWVRVLRMARDSDKWQGKILDVSIGPHGGPQWPTTDAKIQLNLYPVGFVSFAGPLLLVLLLLLLYLGKSTKLLRDDTGAAVPPYSLAKHQMAVWFFVVVAAYLFVTATTGGTAATSSTALMLIGISGATALASVVIDQNKRTAALADGQALKDSQALQALKDERDDLVKTLDARNTDGLRQQLTRAADGSNEAKSIQAQIQEKEARLKEVKTLLAPPLDQVWYRDLLSDENGVSFHRLQIAVWTVVFVVIFARAVWRDFAMPEFDATTLGLMGISSGTYIGFKFPEKP